MPSSSNYDCYKGDAIELMPKLALLHDVRAIITDPPYMINTKSDGMGKLSPWADICNAAAWYREWLGVCKNILRPDGCLWTCLNWRSIPTFTKALCDTRWSFTSMLVWDKVGIGPGMRGLRPRYEMVGLCAMPDFGIADRTLTDIQTFAWSSTKPHGHPAEKPEALMRWLIEISTEPGDTVLDPFMGSGTTGAAALAAGRKFIGIEQDEQWLEKSVARLAAQTEATQCNMTDQS